MLKTISFLVLAFFSALFTVAAFASDGAVVPPSNEEIVALFTAIGGLKGAGALAIAAVVVQALLLAVRHSIGDFLGKYKLLAVYGLTMVAGVLSLHLAGVELGAALVHSNTLAALQVFLNQIWKQFFVKQD